VARLVKLAWTETRIAEELGCSQGTVSKDLKVILAELAEHRIADAEQGRALAREKLGTAEEACVGILLQARDTDPELALKATDRLVRIAERIAKLYGLDAPERLDATLTEGPSPEAAARAIREVFAVSKTNGDDDTEQGGPAGDASAADGSGAGSQ